MPMPMPISGQHIEQTYHMKLTTACASDEGIPVIHGNNVHITITARFTQNK